ncbi:CDP-diacylglycerol--inositol 3-phosphatidyltransferase 1 [Orchesella cincta]|uniref:CDP-diacylglycerol--inositol 3-phosphatidyltransferase 1 n=1 Tax=Orchesella cincta TaxID=48709 RepID=A0A1D2MY87_ORCCI|nr:CDP-diacylglycerol--inositol 3-phosphatidyltransferase 1 [Orchesella cincta]
MSLKTERLSPTRMDILFYVPNIIGYVRLLLLIIAFLLMENPEGFVLLYSFSILLDFFDGWTARKFNQCSAYGAWWGWLIVSIEWITFVGNHQAGSKWREVHAKANPQKQISPPEFVQKIMANGFKTWRGAWVIAGLHILPIWIYAMRNGITDLFLPNFINYGVAIILITGRVQCLACEMWCIQKHVKELLEEDTDK